MHQHPLSVLAFNSFGNYLSDTTVQLVKLAQGHLLTVADFRHQHLLPICNCLEEEIQQRIPHIFANEITNMLLTFLLQTYEQLLIVKPMIRRTDYNLFYEYVKLCTEVVTSIACAVTHSSTTVLRYQKLHDNFVYYKIKFMNAYVVKVLHKTKNLKILDMPNVCLGKNIPPLVNLEYCHANCNDDVISILARGCKNLKVLNVKHSLVTNESVKLFSQFQNLKQLNLCNSKTLISNVGICDVLKMFSELDSSDPNRSLKYLGLDLSRYNQINFPMPFLTTLEITFDEEMVQSVLPLKHLTELTVSSIEDYVPFCEAEKLIREYGNKLKKLMICNMSRIDLAFIANHCPSLQHLVIISQDNDHFPGKELPSVLPQFTSVQVLEIMLDEWDSLECILKSFVNLKIIILHKHCLFKSVTKQLREYLIQKLLNKQFEEVCINENKIVVSGQHACITSVKGYCSFVPVKKLQSIVRDIFSGKQIQNLNIGTKVVSSLEMHRLYIE